MNTKEMHAFASNKSKVEVYKWALLDFPGTPKLLHKSMLQIDTTYQREISEERVLALASAWSWLAFGALSVAKRPDETYFVFDGQHRLEAAKRRVDIRELPCIVFELDDMPKEAIAFYFANCNRRSVTVFSKLRALLAGGDLVAHDAVALMKSEKYQPASRGGEYCVNALGTFLKHFRRDRDLLTKTWPLIAKVHAGRPVSNKPFQAIMYIAKYATPSILTPVGEKRLLELGFDSIVASINRVAAVFEGGGAKVYAQGVIDLLNKGRRTNKFNLQDEASHEESHDNDEDES